MIDKIGWFIAVLFIAVLFIIFIMAMMMAAKEGDKHMYETKEEARWKGAGMGDYYCSLCGEVVSGNHLSECPNCKAKMKEGG